MVKSILVVDDEEAIQELIRLYLSPLKVRLHAAYSGEDGVRLYADMFEGGKRPDLVIMDLKLPGIDGIETINRIMNLDPLARIFGFTAYSQSVWASEMINAGAEQVIPRAIGFSGLREIIRESLFPDHMVTFQSGYSKAQ
jgi:CheY-like chemotaxis protein